MRCTHRCASRRCPKLGQYTGGAEQRLCQEHAVNEVRTAGLTALHPDDRARFLAESAGYAADPTALGA
jgi:hypothetical protein